MTLPIDSLVAKDLKAEQWHYNAIKTMEDYLSVISAFVYSYLSFSCINKYQKWLSQNTSDTNYSTFSWLKNLLLASTILAAVLFVNLLIDHFVPTYHSFLTWQVFYIYLAILIYYIGLKALRGINLAGGEPASLLSPISPKFSTQELEATKIAILSGLENERLFLNGDLTLLALARHLNLSPALVSVAINKTFGKSFRVVINDYRVEEIKLKLADASYAHLSILGIALECGFNSEASFYRIFRSATGHSPKVFLNKHHPMSD